MRMIGDYIAVKPDPLPDTSAGGVLLTGRDVKRAERECRTGIVVSVGTNEDLAQINAGDRVLYHKHQNGQRRTIGGEDVFVLRGRWVLGVVE